MQDLLELILKHITTFPDDVVVEKSTEEGRDVFTIKVNPEDMGRVIGKAGKVIQAIRTLAHVVAIRQNLRIRINLADSGTPAPAPAAAPETEPASEDLLSGAIDLSDTLPVEAAPKTKTGKKAKS